MSEAAIAGVVEQVAAPVVAAILEDLHATASAAITRVEQAAPARLEAAETDVKDWAKGLLGELHAVVAHIAQHRSNLGTPAFADKAKQIITDQFRSELNAEVGRLEGEMPKELDGASAAIKYWVGDVLTLLHKLTSAVPDATAASTVPPTQPSASTPPPSGASPTPAASPTSKPSTGTTSSTAPADAKPGA